MALTGTPSRLLEAQRGGGFVLLAPAGLQESATESGVKTAVPADGGPVRLVRPDGYIAWAADAPTSEDVASAIAAAGV